MNELALFAGAGGGILGGSILGWRTVCAVEYDPNARGMLLARQCDGCLPRFPIWDDVRTFDGHPWRGHVDVVSGGFPCQDISAAGKGAGITGERSGLWREMARIVGEVRPRFVWVENSPMLVKRGLALVLGDLAALGYDARWGVVGADDAGFPHHRKRMWLVGKSIVPGLEGHAWNVEDPGGWEASRRSTCEAGLRLAGWKRVVYFADCDDDGNCPVCGIDFGDCGCIGPTMDEHQYADVDGQMYGRPMRRFVEPHVGGMAHGLAPRLDPHGADAFGGVGRVATGVHGRTARLKAIGNGQVPAAMVLAWRTLMEDMP